MYSDGDPCSLEGVDSFLKGGVMLKMCVLTGINDDDLANAANRWFKGNPTIEIVDVTYKYWDGGTRVTAYFVYRASSVSGGKVIF
jgi:hypothetical protein